MIVEADGEKIMVESELGKGAMFAVSLPAADKKTGAQSRCQ
jgi:signal transduction histidine kinase